MKLTAKSQTILDGLIIFCAALFLRCIFYLFLKDHYFFFNHPSTDSIYFQHWAKEIALGNWLGNQTFYGLPLFPYFLAVLYRLTLFQLNIIPFIFFGLGAANCVLTYLITRRLFSRSAAWFSGFFSTVSFTLIHYDTLIMPNTLAVFLNLSILWLLINQSRIQKSYEWIILGILIGLGALIDSKLLIFTGLFLIYELCQKLISRNFKNFFKERLLIILGIFLIVLSVGVRNKTVGGSWIWITAQSGLSFFAGNNPEASGLYSHPSFMRPDHQGQDEDQKIIAERITHQKLSDKQVSDFWFQQGLTFIKNNPQAYLKLLKNKFKYFFTDTQQAWDIDLLLQRAWKNSLDMNPYWIICPLALLGILLSFNQYKQEQIYPLLLLTSQLIFTMIFFLTDRHRSVALPIFIIYQSFLLAWMIEQLNEKRYSYLISAFVLSILFFYLFPRTQRFPDQEWKFLYATKSAPIYAAQGKLLEAESMYKQALAIYPNDSNTLYNLGSYYTLNRRYAQAIPIFLKIVSENPYQVDALYNLAYCYKETGNIDKALELFDRVNHLQPQSLDVISQLFQIYLNQKNCSQAQIYADQLIYLNPKIKSEVQDLLLKCSP